jgi:hypothetical protein
VGRGLGERNCIRSSIRLDLLLGLGKVKEMEMETDLERGLEKVRELDGQ